MAANLYLGVDGTARRIRALYFGAVTDCPIYELFCQGCFISFSNNKNYGARSLCRSLLPTYPKQYQKKK